jgi:uncharacterized protein (DUF924 family)
VDSSTATPDALLSFWFGPLDAEGRADAAHRERWFRKDAAFDRELRERFGTLHAEVAAGRHESWLATPRGRLAYVIALDQLSRNLFRDSARAFETDARALEVALEGLSSGVDRALARDERSFLYMPLMHSEDLAVQERCVALFADFPDNLPFAEAHRDIVRRFKRFPHRNAVLGRASTPEELAFLQEPGSSF